MNHYKRTSLYAITACTLCYIGCSDPKEQEPNEPNLPSVENSYLLRGNVEKGPFISGSEINIQELDSGLNPTGRIFKTNIKNHEGYFDLGELSLVSPYARLSASGYYYNEVEGSLSTAPIVLNALVDLSDNKSVNLNLLTHLKQDRVTYFIKEEKLSFVDANQKAQNELFSIFSLQQYADKEASEFSITAGTQEAGALITLSSTLLYGTTDAEFSESLAIFNEQFSQKGTVSEDLKKGIKRVSRELDFDFISSALIARYESLGKSINVENLRRFVDWDDNGVAGDEREDWDEEPVLKFEQDTLVVPCEGGTIYLDLTTNLPISLENPVDGPETIEPITTQFWITGTSEIRKTLSKETKQLILEVTPASERLMNPQEIKVYSTFGGKSTTITVIQEGDLNKPYEISDDGKGQIDGIMYQMQSAYSYFHTMEAFYTNCWNAPYFGEWTDFEKHTLNSSNWTNSNAFNAGFIALARINFIRTSARNDKFTHLLCQNIEALIYTDMLSFWGNLPYSGKTNESSACIPYESSRNIFAYFEESLEELIPILPDKNMHPIQSIVDNFVTSADVARFNLARINIAKEEFQSALGLLRQIIGNGHYQISNSRQSALTEESAEIIFPVLSNNENNIFSNVIEKNKYYAIMPYTEVVLLAAECAYKLGNTDDARMYLHQVTDIRNTSYNTEASFIEQLRSVWQQELKGSNSYFGFLKRNGLAVDLLHIDAYRQLFPIPAHELNLNPCVIQNPGY